MELNSFVPLWKKAFALALTLTATPAFSLSVANDGSVKCDSGRTPIYWEEDTGVSETYRDILVFNFLPDFGILLRSPMNDQSFTLDSVTGGTSVPWRGLVYMDKNEAYGSIRFIRAATDDDDPAKKLYSGKPVNIALVDSRVFWPTCANTSTVEEWLKAVAGKIGENDTHTPNPINP